MKRTQYPKDHSPDEPPDFQHLVEEYQDMVLNVCYSFLNNYQDALDVSQEVFIKAYQGLHRFKGKSKLSSWLYRIAVNTSLNHIRHNKKNGFLRSLDLLFDNVDSEAIPEPSDPDEDTSEQISDREDHDILWQAIDQLPEKQRTAITLNKFEELSYKEIADIMDIQVSETGVLINRAKKNLQKHILKNPHFHL